MSDLDIDECPTSYQVSMLAGSTGKGASLYVRDSIRSVLAARSRFPTLEPKRLANPRLRRVLTDLALGASETASDAPVLLS